MTTKGTGIALAATGFAVGLTIAIVIAVSLSGPAPTPQAVANASASPSGTGPTGASATSTVAPSVIVCHREVGPLPPMLASDPCPSAITAVELAVATVRLPIDRMVIETGPLFCNVVWEGVDTPPPCFGPIEIVGQYMHAYVSFHGSDEVAVVMLGLDLPPDLETSLAPRPPWNTTLLAVAVPPPGWVMPAG